MSGTSFAAPLVTGVVGLVKTHRPSLSAAAAKEAVVNGARRADTLAGKVASGGVVNASGALGSLRGPYDTPGAGGGNGNGNGQGGSAQRPPDPGRGRGNYTGTPPPATPTAPAGGPDLNRLRDEPSHVPQEPPPPGISSNAPPVCEDCYEASGSSDPQFSRSRGQLPNETGQPAVDLGSKNFNWSLPLFSLPGRAGHDLSLTLFYNSLVWVKQGNAMQFNADGGYPSPGFQLGFPQLQKPFTDANGQGAYMMVTPSGGRITLRYVSAGLYEDREGSYAQLQILAGNWARVTTTDGTQYTFEPTANNEKRCREIKDRNGNIISIGYDGAGRVSAATDTLGRVVNFVYNGNGQLFQLTQDRAGSGHGDVLAQFAYADLYMSPYFTDAGGNLLPTLGPSGAAVSVLIQVWVPDGTTYNFGYTHYGQVYKITRRAADGHDLSYEWYNLPSSPDTQHIAQQDCPRFTERRDWAEYGVMQASQAVSTFYGTNAAGTVTEVTYPDNKTVYREYFSDGSNGVRAGLTTGSETRYENVAKKWTTVTWGSDAGGWNPRVTETTVEDAEGNFRRTAIDYTQGYSLPTHVREYGEVNGQEVMLRLTTTSYNLDPAYVSRRVIGLPGERTVFDGPTGYIVARQWYMYDWGAPYFNTQSPSVQYADPNLLAGRGNLVAVYRLSCQGNSTTCDGGGIWAERTGYDMAGSPVWVMDALGHQTTLSYSDSFSDASKNGLGTRAYATSVTDAENYTATAKYDYTTGAPTETRRPSSGTSAQNNVTYETHVLEYDWAARPTKDSTQNNGFYTRWEYPADGRSLKTFQNIRPDLSENYSVTVFDGVGRVRRTATYMPGSTTRYSGRQFYYDNMGRLAQWTNPTDTTGDPDWTAAGDDAAPGGFGWVSTSRTYDWQGRPRVTTYPDNTTTESTYGGCGCAGGEVVTARDQRGRLKKSYHDALGRLTKVEELDYNSAVYSTAVYTYNARDQVTNIKHHQGTNGPYQERTFGYDGHGRLSSRTTPEQGTTNYSYYDDDTLHVLTDARGATQTFGYTERHLVNSIEFNAASGVAATPNVSFGYDAAGSRTQMTKAGQVTAAYHYDSLSRMDWESRAFNGLGTYYLYYGYNNAGLEWVNNHWGSSVNYTADHTGATTAAVGSGTWAAPTYVQGVQYRASGGVKSASYGNGRALSMKYDKMLRIDEWGVSGVSGWKYSYSDFGENTGRVTFAQNTFESVPGQAGGPDPTLDRSYNYDLAGRLDSSYTGSKARWHAGRPGGNEYGTDGPYAQALARDVWGNITQKTGHVGPQYAASYTNNRRDGFVHDAAGNLINDVGQTFTYDATGQQATAAYPGYSLQQTYDGDRLRVKKVDNGVATYYLRSSVFGGQVVAEINSAGGWARGYVYGAGGGLLALQTSGGVTWVYKDAATKSQRLADSSGNVTAKVDLDPWGEETGRSQNSQQQPRKYTTYERDVNGADEAMMRRYNRWHQRFDQPDPSDDSYDLADPQSFNRYVYANNDPVNLIDPSGLMSAASCGAEYGFSECGGGGGFWGGNFGGNVAEYNREFGGLSTHIASALAAHQDRIQNTMDALDAQSALEAGNYELLHAIMEANPTLELREVGSPVSAFLHIFNPFSFQKGGRTVPNRPRGGGGGGGRTPRHRFPGLKDHRNRHPIGSRPLTYAQYLRSAINHTRNHDARYLLHYHVDGHNFRRWNYVTRLGNDSFLFTSTSENGRLIFTHMVVPGRTIRNHGIQVTSYPPEWQGPPGRCCP